MTAGSADLRCACGNTLGVFADARFVSCHQGRVVEARLLMSVCHERGGRTITLNATAAESLPSSPPEAPAGRHAERSSPPGALPATLA
jgi:hypothetical protein